MIPKRDPLDNLLGVARRFGLWLPLRLAWWPCPDCCGSCVVFEDTFNRDDDTDIGDDWTEAVGDSSIVSNELSMPSGAMVTCDVTGGATFPYIVDITATLASGERVSVVVDFDDVSNYYFVELYRSSSSTYTLKVYKRVAGANTQLDVWNLSSSTNNELFLRVCVNQLEGYVAANLFEPATPLGNLLAIVGGAASSPTLASTTVGLWANSGNVAVNSFVFQRHYTSDDADCPYCRGDCFFCDVGKTPAYVQIEVPPMTGRICTDAQCAAIAGTYIVPVNLSPGCAGCFDIPGGGACGKSIGFLIAGHISPPSVTYSAHTSGNLCSGALFLGVIVEKQIAGDYIVDCISQIDGIELTAASESGCLVGDPWIATALF